MMPQMPSYGWGEKLPSMFYYAKWFISEYQAWIMVGLAISIAFTILAVIVNLFDRRRDDDDEDYEYREI